MALPEHEDPVSVVLPAALKKRILAEAKRRGLKLSPTIRVLLGERIHDLDDAAQLSRAEEWQRAEAWATWERILAEGPVEATEADLEAAFAEPTPPTSPRRRTKRP